MTSSIDVLFGQWDRQLERERITMIVALATIGVGAAAVIGYAFFRWLTGR